MQKRFKWNYFDFLMWISYLPFLFFAFLQLQNFNFDNFLQGVSSLLAIAIAAIYPLYPVWILYLLKENYIDLCLGSNNLVEMSLSPFVYNVKRPEELPEEGNFIYFSWANFRLAFYALKYLRKIILIAIVAFGSDAISMLSALIALNVIFIAYILIFRPRKMPFIIFDLIIEFILLGFEVFMLTYVVLDGSKIGIMSIIAHGVGFIMANLSLVVAIVLNLIAYYKIFMCVYELVKHLQHRAE